MYVDMQKFLIDVHLVLFVFPLFLFLRWCLKGSVDDTLKKTIHRSFFSKGAECFLKEMTILVKKL